MHLLSGFIANYPLISALAAIILAQFIKIPLHYLYHHEWDFKRFIGTGGMPSSHSAGVTALASAIGYQNGVNSSDFALSVVLGLVVMFDAMGIRRHAGEQAMAINELQKEFKQHIETREPNYSRRAIRHRRKRLKELLGHQPIEVAAGAAFGVAVGLLFHFLYR